MGGAFDEEGYKADETEYSTDGIPAFAAFKAVAASTAVAAAMLFQ